jgi:hypothetical protein
MGKTKKNKVADLRPEKISDEQLKELQQIAGTINKLQFDIGNVEAQKHSLLHTLFQGNDRLNEMRSAFTEQYGTSDINIQDGILNYKEDGPSDS